MLEILYRSRIVVSFITAMSSAVHLTNPNIKIDVRVMFFDTDCAQIVHNLAYLRFIETARTLLAEQLGMDLQAMARAALFPVLVRTEVDYKRSAIMGDTLTILGQLESVERTRFWCTFEVRRPSDDLLICTARQLLAMVQMPAAKVVRLPEEMVQRYGHLAPKRDKAAR